MKFYFDVSKRNLKHLLIENSSMVFEQQYLTIVSSILINMINFQFPMIYYKRHVKEKLKLSRKSL